MNNAINYTGDDRRVAVEQSVRGKTVRISVTDTGDGIPEQKLPLIWERYYKASEYHKRGAVGTGLGLSIVKGILDKMGGTYGVSSTVGEGSTFWFELPVASSPDGGGENAFDNADPASDNAEQSAAYNGCSAAGNAEANAEPVDAGDGPSQKEPGDGGEEADDDA